VDANERPSRIEEFVLALIEASTGLGLPESPPAPAEPSDAEFRR
jgi:hypothetical protein